MRGGGQDTEIELFLDVKLLAEFGCEHAPLVIAEVVEHHEVDFLTLAEQGEHLVLEHLWREDRTVAGRSGGVQLRHPVEIVLLDKLCEAQVRFLFLHAEHIGHRTVSRAQLQLPVHEFLIDFHPVLPRSAIHDLHGDLLELLLVLRLRHLRLDLFAVDVLLQCQQNLVGVHGLDQIVGNLLSDGLIHDVLFLALGHHHHG